MKEKSTSCTLWFMAILVDIKLSLKIVLFKEKDTSESKKNHITMYILVTFQFH